MHGKSTEMLLMDIARPSPQLITLLTNTCSIVAYKCLEMLEVQIKINHLIYDSFCNSNCIINSEDGAMHVKKY